MAATTNSIDAQLAADIGALYADPLAFVRYAFPWGEPGPLADETGPDDWQVDILTTLGHEIRKGCSVSDSLRTATQIAVSSGHGIGKLHDLDTVIDTPAGRVRWGDLSIGDTVFGADGRPTRITAIPYRGVRPCYRVTFDDGSSTIVGREHLWAVRGQQERRRGLDGWRKLETHELIEQGVKRRNGDAWARQWEIPIQGAAEFPHRDGLPLDPYVMGLWLSDGCGNTITKHSPAVRRKVMLIMPAGRVNNQLAGGRAFSLLGVDWTLPVFECRPWQKYIPDDYKYASIEQRTALFEGLMDGDGECRVSGSCGYSSSSERLLNDVVWLARSLGYKASKQKAIKAPTHVSRGQVHDGRPNWRATIQPDHNPFVHEKRRAAFNGSASARYRKRWIDRIEPVGDREGMCISVEAMDGLYLADDFIVTHNSGLVAWLVIWFASTRPDCQIVVTANTATQLTTKTWREVAKWHRMAINAHWFKWTATRFYAVAAPSTWFASAIPWSENNPEAFAGTHESEVLIIFDEASRVADIIWETASGALTTSGAVWLVFGNPTRNTGRFRECFGKQRHRWITRQVDSRTAKMANTAQLQQWVDDYGEDSDYVRVRVRGLFPRVGDVQLIGLDTVEAAMECNLEVATFGQFPKMLGVDVARFGDDMSVIYRRQGPMVWEPKSFNRIDTMELAGHILDEARDFGARMVFIDGVGVGGGVVDRLRQFPDLDVIDVQSGERATDHKRFKNRRMELWWRLKEWLDGEVSLPAGGHQLRDDLIAPEYGFDASMRMFLEGVESMKGRGLASPDYASALAMTFADFTATGRKRRAQTVQRVKWA